MKEARENSWKDLLSANDDESSTPEEKVIVIS